MYTVPLSCCWFKVELVSVFGILDLVYYWLPDIWGQDQGFSFSRALFPPHPHPHLISICLSPVPPSVSFLDVGEFSFLSSVQGHTSPIIIFCTLKDPFPYWFLALHPLVGHIPCTVRMPHESWRDLSQISSSRFQQIIAMWIKNVLSHSGLFFSFLFPFLKPSRAASFSQGRPHVSLKR